jgi:SAM-dependent methyltransferase
MAEPPRYDRIGTNYATFRQPEPTWVVEIDDVLGSAERVLNVGAGTGNYEPSDRVVLALEPSPVMLGQRRAGAAPAVQGVAEHLPFPDDSFDVALAVLTVHHWSDRVAGVRELRRVANRQIVVAYEPLVSTTIWLLDYFPELVNSPTEVDPPTPETLSEVLDVREVRTLWVPTDSRGGFLAAYWNRPERYLDPAAQEAISLFALMEPAARAAGVGRLAADLESGAWHERYGELLTQERADYGYRLVSAGDANG